jgi:hypothetical protein
MGQPGDRCSVSVLNLNWLIAISRLFAASYMLGGKYGGCLGQV